MRLNFFSLKLLLIVALTFFCVFSRPASAAGVQVQNCTSTLRPGVITSMPGVTPYFNSVAECLNANVNAYLNCWSVPSAPDAFGGVYTIVADTAPPGCSLAAGTMSYVFTAQFTCSSGFLLDTSASFCVNQNCTAGPSALTGTSITYQGPILNNICATDGCMYNTDGGITTTDGRSLSGLTSGTGASCNSSLGIKAPPLSASGVPIVPSVSGVPATPASSSVPPSSYSSPGYGTSSGTTSGTSTSTSSTNSSGVTSTTTIFNSTTASSGVSGGATESTLGAFFNSFNNFSSASGVGSSSGSFNNGASAVSGQDSAATGLLSSAGSGLDADRTGIAWWTWQPPLVNAACTTFNHSVHGYLVVLDFCPYVIMLRDLLGWLLAIFTAWHLYGLVIRGRA